MEESTMTEPSKPTDAPASRKWVKRAVIGSVVTLAALGLAIGLHSCGKTHKHHKEKETAADTSTPKVVGEYTVGTSEPKVTYVERVRTPWAGSRGFIEYKFVDGAENRFAVALTTKFAGHKLTPEQFAKERFQYMRLADFLSQSVPKYKTMATAKPGELTLQAVLRERRPLEALCEGINEGNYVEEQVITPQGVELLMRYGRNTPAEELERFRIQP
jgi:hypothetical protein